MTKKKETKKEQNSPKARPPVVAVMGHIDHGKSTLLDYIRKTNIVDKEAGGITQHISAYEFEHETKDGKKNFITFLDTPGHQAFSGIRSLGATVADVAILIVSAEDGFKPQTKEALDFIKKAGTPYIVAVTKIDLPNADIEKAKQSLAENEIFIEGYGGDVPFVAVSSKTGEGIDDLLDLILLVAELEELSGNPNEPASGVVIETNTDSNKGASASLIIKNGTLSSGMAVATESSFAPVRIMENFLGKPVKEACFSSPIKIYGWNTLPLTGETFQSYKNKQEAEKKTQQSERGEKEKNVYREETNSDTAVVPIIITADTAGTLQAIVDEIKKIPLERVELRIIQTSVGSISDTHVKLACTHKNAILVGFNVKADTAAQSTAERLDIDIKTFSIIYELLEWVENKLKEKTPKISVEEKTGALKVLKTFGRTKTKQVIGGKVVEGEINVNDQAKVLRRGEEIGRGTIKNLQQQQIKTSKVEKGNECGLELETKNELAGGDVVETFHVVEK